MARDLDQARARRARSVRAGQARRGGPARAGPRAGGQARLQRGPVRALPGSARGARAGPPGAESLSGRGRLRASSAGSPRSTASSPSSVAVAAGADAVIAYLCARHARPRRRGRLRLAVLRELPARGHEDGRDASRASRSTDHRYDVERILGAITGRTKIVYLCNPNNPTGTMISRDEVDAYFDRVPSHVLTVLDEAYFEYVDEPDYPDGIEEHVKAGPRRARAAHLLEDLRPGRSARRLRRRAQGGRRRGQEGAERLRRHPAGAGRRGGQPRRRRRRSRAAGRSTPRRGRTWSSSAAGLEPDARAAPRRELRLRGGGGGRARRSSTRSCARASSSARSAPFGAPGAIRVTVGTKEENELFARGARARPGARLMAAELDAGDARRGRPRAATGARSRGRSPWSRTATRSPTS